MSAGAIVVVHTPSPGSSTTLNQGGVRYAAGDTGIVDPANASAEYKVAAVDPASGSVRAYAIVSPGAGYVAALNVATKATTGNGSGFAINIVATTSAVDLTTVADCLPSLPGYGRLTTPSELANVQACITAASAYWLSVAGEDPNRTIAFTVRRLIAVNFGRRTWVDPAGTPLALGPPALPGHDVWWWL